MSSMDETYNGWKNYPTWAVNLWLSNEEPLYREALELAESANDLSHAPEIRRGDVADKFKFWVTQDLAPDLGASFAADLLGYALDCVDWYEIAGAWIKQVEDSVAVEP